MQGKTVYLFLILSLVFLLLPSGVEAGEYKQFPAAIHVQSTVSSGIYSISELADSAREHNLKILILTDHAAVRAEYGLFPLRRLVRKVIEKESILRYGAKEYLDLVREVDKSHPELVLLAGAEVSPFYYWKGSYFEKNLTMCNWDKEILLIGLNKESDYENLPLVPNPHSLSFYNWQSSLQFWPLIPLIFGFWLMKIRKTRRLFYGKQVFVTHSPLYKIVGLLIIVSSGLFLINNLPFSHSKYDQYHDDQGVLPYQNLIDYANKKGGLTFWSAPEAATNREIGEVRMFTPAHPQDLRETENYTGFAALYQDNITFTDPGKGWDQILIDYCQGKRRHPVWGIGEIDYHGLMENVKKIDTIQTVFLLANLNKEEVLEALREGRMYALLKGENSQLSLDDFSLKSRGKKAFQGDELECEGKAGVCIRVSSSDGEKGDVEIRVVRNGEVTRIFNDKTPLEIEFEDDYYVPGERIYYRLDVRSPSGSVIISNPIFAKFAQ